MSEKILEDISNKLNILISLSIKQLNGDKDFSNKSTRKRGVGDYARYLANYGIDAKEISRILNAPLQSIRTLLTPKRSK